MIETLMARSQKPPTAITPLQGGGGTSLGAGRLSIRNPCVKRRCGRISPSERQAMRRLLIVAAVASATLTAMLPAEAKSIWLECTHPKNAQVINLDSAKERFSLTYKV